MIIKNAIKLACILHKGQVRKDGTTPYIAHPVEVASTLQTFLPPLGNYQDIIAAAYLHDVLEDCVTENLSKEDIGKLIGGYCNEKVLRIVLELTNESIKDEHKNKLRAERKEIDRQKLMHVTLEAKMIKYVDIICNLNDEEWIPSKYTRLLLDESRKLCECMYVKDMIIASLYQVLRNLIEEKEKLIGVHHDKISQN